MRQFLNLLKRITHRVLKVVHAVFDSAARVLTKAMENLAVEETEEVVKLAVEAAVEAAV